MLLQWLKDNPLETVLLDPSHCLPYPIFQDRQGWNAVDAELKKERIRIAEKWLGYEWRALPATAFLAYVRTGDRIVYETPHFARRWALGDLVVGECLEGEGRFLDDIVNGIWCLCEESFWGVPAHNWSPGFQGEALPNVEAPYIDLFAAETAALLAWTRHLLGNRLASVSWLINRRIDIELEWRILKPFVSHEDFFWMGYDERDVVNNWNAWIVSNLTSVFLLTNYEPYLRNKGIAKLMLCTDRFLAAYPEDGGCDEGTSYWLAAGGALFDTLDQMYHATGGRMDFGKDALIQNIGRFIYRSYIAGQYFINFADGAARVQLAKDMVYRYGRYIGDAKMMGLAASLESDPDRADIPVPLRRLLPSLFNHGELTQCTLPCPYEADVWLPDIQVMAARQHAGSDRGLYFAAKGGHNGENHNHNDVGSCIVYLDGMPALIDAGVGAYTKQTFSEDRYSLWTMQSGYHNLPDINGQMQKDGRQYRALDVVYEAHAGQVSFSLALEEAYPASAGLIRYRRAYAFHRSQEAWLLLRDDYAFRQAGNAIAVNLMCWQRPRVVADGLLQIPISAENALYLWYPAGAEAHIEHLDTPDYKLNAVWGDQGVHRISLRYAGLPAEGRVDLLFRQGLPSVCPARPNASSTKG